jgi:hypothetical protein
MLSGLKPRYSTGKGEHEVSSNLGEDTQGTLIMYYIPGETVTLGEATYTTASVGNINISGRILWTLPALPYLSSSSYLEDTVPTSTSVQFTVISPAQTEILHSLLTNTEMNFTRNLGLLYENGDVLPCLSCINEVDREVIQPDSYLKMAQLASDGKPLQWVSMTSLDPRVKNSLAYYIDTNRWVRRDQLEVFNLPCIKHFIKDVPSATVTFPDEIIVNTETTTDPETGEVISEKKAIATSTHKFAEMYEMFQSLMIEKENQQNPKANSTPNTDSDNNQ